VKFICALLANIKVTYIRLAYNAFPIPNRHALRALVTVCQRRLSEISYSVNL